MPLRRRVYGTLCYTENVMAGRLFESVRRRPSVGSYGGRRL